MKLTPAMEQFMRVKNEHPDCILLFRMGDFYETFFDDAKKVSRALNIVLTARGKDKVPLAGIPYHSIDPYINKLIKQGFKVAMVEQLEDPKKVKGRVVKRGLVRIITPGTVLDSNVLDERENNFLVSISYDKVYGLSAIDLSTGEFITTEIISFTDLVSELRKINPSEIIVAELNEKSDWVNKLRGMKFFVNSFSDVFYFYENAVENLKKHFKVISLSGFGLDGKKVSISACGSIISYLKATQMSELQNVSKIRYYKNTNFMLMDSTTIRNLELFSNVFDNSRNGSLMSILDKTQTPMGSRKLKSWLLRPLISKDKIEERLECIDEFKNSIELGEIRDILKESLDIERLISRISNNVNNPKDLIGLKRSLELVPKYQKLIEKFKGNLVKKLFNANGVEGVVDIISESIKDDPPSFLREGNVIRNGFSKELDELRDISRNAKKFISDLEAKEREKTGIKSLKIRYNRVFGYFIEVTKSNLEMVPSHYIRKQTQVNSERFITGDLKEKEELILNSSEKQIEIEQRLYSEIVEKVLKFTKVILDIADDISTLDVLSCFSYLAVHNDYCRPQISNNYLFEVEAGRHPVIEQVEENYIPNDCKLDSDLKMMIITGPNMSGKSSYMRQNALIMIMAQMGCFVPAKKANIGIVDRVFTRIGAFDDISSGQSTFMVEMNETANIVNNASEKSFVVLDEIGRGTSTYDGISLAWAIAEYIIKKIGAKTMFATHYHQLNRLSEYYKSIKNFHITVLEEKDNIVFLHKIEEGGTDRSYGIEVAKLAGLPKELIEDARRAMSFLEVEDEVAEKIHGSVALRKNDIKKKVEEKMKQLKLDNY